MLAQDVLLASGGQILPGKPAAVTAAANAGCRCYQTFNPQTLSGCSPSYLFPVGPTYAELGVFYGHRYVRISTWCGTWTYRAWAKKYCVGVEDPFDCTDNCARTIAAHASSAVANKFGDAVQHMALIDSSTVLVKGQAEGEGGVEGGSSQCTYVTGQE